VNWVDLDLRKVLCHFQKRSSDS